MTVHIDTNSTEATEKIAEGIGGKLRGGEVIELVSDLGGGKTAFVRGLARGMGSPDRVASPTFTVSKIYKSADLELHHFDLYRLTDAGLMAHEIEDVMENPKAVVVIEWGDVAAHILPDDRLTIRIERTGEETRKLALTYPSKLAYLVGRL